MDLERVGVVGCGLMGAGIAEVSARRGTHVAVVDANEAAVKAGRDRIETSLANAVRRGKLAEGEAEQARAALSFSTDLGSLADRQLVVEAVPESETIKVDVFRSLDVVVEASDAILASNTSSIPIMKLAMATATPRAGRRAALLQPRTGAAARRARVVARDEHCDHERAAAFASDVLGKRVIRSQDRAGFIVNALLIPYLLSAIRMLESGFATAEDIDTGMVQGCAHPMGPLALADLIGLDTTMAVAGSLYEEFKEPLYAAPPLLSRMVEAGLLGRKSGRGFHRYGE